LAIGKVKSKNKTKSCSAAGKNKNTALSGFAGFTLMYLTLRVSNLTPNAANC
jgi:hypothetical protein